MKKPAQPRLVVGVGASAGGLEAFKQLLGVLPDRSGMAFLLVQHLDPTHESLLVELLTPLTKLSVRTADHGLVVEPDTIYIIRPDTALAVRKGRTQLSEPTLHRGVRLPVNHLFQSLAREYGPRAVGVVLSGAGTDGTAGMRDIKAVGGIVIAQEPGSTAQSGMPQSAIDTGLVDMVLEIPEIPAALERFASLPATARRASSGQTPSPVDGSGDRLAHLTEQQIAQLGAVLLAQLGFDLGVYKRGTIERRVLRRMGLASFGSVESYLAHLRESPAEQQTLVRDLLINVTEFFRDPKAFQVLRERVIEPLVQRADPGASLRAWVPGCATGEEAYSIAMEFLDAVEAHDKHLHVQIFATDVDREALALARTAIYPASAADQVSRRQLEAYFSPLEGKGYQVQSRLRDVVSFALHDLTKDPPFSRMDLVSCRNVLIYLTPPAQRHVLKLLHFSLRPEGALFLGTSESLGAQRGLFSTLSKTQRIFRKLGPSKPMTVPHSRMPMGQDMDTPQTSSSRPRAAAGATGDPARRAVLEALVPPTLVVSEDGTVLLAHGELSRYLRIPEGENPRFELAGVLRPEFATRVRGVLYKCRRDHAPVTALSSPEDGAEQVRIRALPAPHLGGETVILTFEALPQMEAQAEAPTSQAPGTAEDAAVIEQLEKELTATREDLRNTVEELETSNEELRSSNEESMSMNEELQSANEELEATTEELRSLNEELTTVNAQLREKVDLLERAHDDLQNFFASTKIATLFLDEKLRIKRFTPAAAKLLGIGAVDEGRNVGDIARELLHLGLAEQASTVLENLAPMSAELRTSDGHWISRQILPYRTQSRRIEGVVVTFSDITELRVTNTELQSRNHRLELAWEAAPGGVFEHRVPLDAEGLQGDRLLQLLGRSEHELPPPSELLAWMLEQVHPDDRQRLEEAYTRMVKGTSDRLKLEFRLRHRGGHWVWLRLVARAVERQLDGTASRILGVALDISDLKEVEGLARQSEQRFRDMTDGLPLMVWLHDAAGDQELVNQTFCEYFGVDRDAMKGGRWQLLVHPDDAESYTRAFYAALSERHPFHGQARVRHASGEWRWVESWARPRYGADGEFEGMVGSSLDITERRQMESGLRESEERFRMLSDNIPQLAWMARGDGWIFWYNQRWYDFTGTTLEDVQGWGWRSLHHPDHVDRVVERVSGCFERGEVWEDTFPLRGASGEYRWFLSRAVPIRDAEGKVVRWFGTNTDVTEQRQTEQLLVDMSNQKDVFIAMLGHELRNPLAAIRTASELLKRRGDDPAVVRRAQPIVERQTAHMARLLDGLLDISRIIRGKIELNVQLVDLTEVCREVVADHAEQVNGRPLELVTELPDHPVWVEGDRVRLTQIADNLVSNALKFTEEGTVTLSLEEGDDTAVLVVRDTGVGIDPSLLPHVFEPFRQAEQSLDRARGGLGLGLALVKSLADLHRGRVACRSEGRGQGAEFRLELPTPTSVPERKRPEDGDDRPLHILLVEDNVDSAEMLKVLLELSGHRVGLATRGAEGVEAAREELPDLVLCDLGLPDGMSGFDVAETLRGDPRTASIPLVALSGYAQAEDKRRCEVAGFDTHLTKPVEIEQLNRVLGRYAARRPAKEA